MASAASGFLLGDDARVVEQVDHPAFAAGVFIRAAGTFAAPSNHATIGITHEAKRDFIAAEVNATDEEVARFADATRKLNMYTCKITTGRTHTCMAFLLGC